MFGYSSVVRLNLPVRVSTWTRLTLLFLFLAFQLPHPLRAQTTRTLTDLIGWQIPGLDSVKVEGVVVGDGYFTGNIPALAPGSGGTAPVIAGFSMPGADGFAVVVSFSSFSFPDYLGALRGSGLENLAFSELRLVFPPSGSEGSTAQPPAQVASITGASLALPSSPGVSGVLALQGNPAALMSSLGVGVSALPVSGTIPVGLFTGGVTAGNVATALYPFLDLTISAPAALLAAAQPPVPGATLDSLALHVDGLSGEPAFLLTGGITLAGHAFGVAAKELGGQAGPAIDITGDVTLGDLAGTQVPGLSELAVTSLRIEEGSLAGALTFREVDFHVVVFETEGHGAPNVALMVPELKLSTFSPAFEGTPFDDLELKPAGLILVPEGNGSTQARLPTAVSDATGQEEMALQPGLNMASLAAASGMVGDLLDLLRVPKKGLHLGGTFDPAVFSNAVFSSGDAAALARQIEIDLSVPLGDISIPGAPDFFTSSGNILSLNNGPDGFAVSVMSDVRVHFDGSDPLEFTGTSIILGQEDGHEFAAISGHAAITWSSPFGISWINLHGLDLAAKFGTLSEFSIGSTTDLGSVKGLDVTTSLTLNGSSIQEAGLALTGKDIPLNAIPLFSAFPSVSEFTLRDITVSNTAISGKAKATGLPQVEAVLFESQLPQRGWNLAMMMSGLGIMDIIPGLPDSEALRAILDQVKLDDLVMMVSEYGVTDEMTALPRAAQQTLTDIFGAARNVRVPNGLGLLGGFDPATLSPEVQQALSTMGIGNQKLVLGGSIGGVFGGGSPSFDLAAMLPAVNLPEEIQFLGLPASLQGSFYFKFLSFTDLGFGVAVSALSNMPTQNKPLALENDIYLEINPTGGVEVGVKGTTKGPWEEAFGIQGFDMLAGSELGVSISATSEVHMTAAGHAMVGGKEVEVTGAFGLIVGSGAPVPSRGSFSGQLSSMSLEDVMAMTNGVATVGGGPPIKADYPDVTLTDMLFAFASPGETIVARRVGSDETLTLTGPGVAMAGKLWLFFPDGPLGDFDGQIDATGLTAKGAIHDFTLGGLTMTGNNLDIAATTNIMNPPHFRISGEADINGTGADVHMDAEVTSFTFSTGAALGGSDFSYDFGVYYVGPSSLTPQGLAELDLGVDTEVEVGAIEDFLMGPGADAAKQGLDDVNAAADSLTGAVDVAQAALNTVSDSVAKYRAVAQRDQADRNQALTDASKRLNDASALAADLGRKADAAGARIHPSCNQTQKTCVTLFGVKTCVTHPDLVKQTQCTAENAANLKDRTTCQAEQVLATQAAKRAQDALDLLKDGNSAIPIDEDPRVVGWIELQRTAQAALDAAKKGAAGVEAATAAANRALSVFQAGASAVKVTRAHMRGSLKEMMANRPLILDVDYLVSGQQLSTRIPFNPGDMPYTTNHLQLLALQAAYVVSENDPDASDAVKKVFRDRYLAKVTETAAEVDAVNERNNVLPDSGTAGGD